ncbi:lysozyme [Bradyrhizobium rifense]|uniref:Lysozyme n=1 Tax=Bradyrhizobium rifense TaxID=515499 RepID=A0A5D3K9V1_9BRAD|nr:glycoside hydrolase family protein [Bradyrhizobium rifense]TYL92542.1 lysozyme [Bradyrhizobium rifense]
MIILSLAEWPRQWHADNRLRPYHAAGGLQISQGLCLTRAQADELLSEDLAPCERAVNRLLKARGRAHQFDALVDIYFNCASGAIAVIKLINAGADRGVGQAWHDVSTFSATWIGRGETEIVFWERKAVFYPFNSAPCTQSAKMEVLFVFQWDQA